MQPSELDPLDDYELHNSPRKVAKLFSPVGRNFPVFHRRRASIDHLLNPMFNNNNISTSGSGKSPNFNSPNWDGPADFRFNMGSGNSSPLEMFEPEDEDYETTIWDIRILEWKKHKSQLNMAPLKQLCFKAVVQEAQKKDCQQQHLLLLHKLTNELKSELLLYLQSSKQRILGCYAKQLLFEDMPFFDLGVVKRGEDQAEVWQHLKQKCTNIKGVVMRDYSGIFGVKFPTRSLGNIPNLVHIEMPDFHCDDYVFTVFANHFQKLQVLQVSLGKITDVAVEMMLKLKNLRVFDFHGSQLQKRYLDRDVMIMATLLHGLPRLEILWPTYPVTCSTSRPLAWLSATDIKKTLALTHLRVSFTPFYDTQLLPNVHTLYLTGNYQDFLDDTCILDSFKELRSLSICMSYLPKKLLHPFLFTKDQLKELVIDIKGSGGKSDDSVPMDLDLSYIFTVCSQLSKLHVFGNVCCIDRCRSVNLDNFSMLEDVKIRVNSPYYHSQMINYILIRAPELRILQLGPVAHFLRNDLENVLKIQLEQDDGAFGKLRELWLTFYGPEINYEVTDLIKTMLCNAIHIEKVVIENSADSMSYGEHGIFFDDLAQFCKKSMPDVDFILV